jgi:membrane protein
MISALNLAYRVQETRSWLKVRAIAIGLTLVISILLLMALILVLVSSRLFDWIGAELRLQPIVVQLVKAFQWPVAILFMMISYPLGYFAGPTLSARHWHWVTPGSAFGTLLWLLASLGFREYLHFYNTYSSTYGSWGAVMILLVWLYVTALSFLVGGEIDAELERAACSAGVHSKLR